MNQLNLYRRRLIPNECIFLKDDIILECRKDIIVTKWNTLKPRPDLHHGFSCYFCDKGWKVSKLYDAQGNLLYYYCDIVTYEELPCENKLIVTDLLADVIVYPNGFVKVIDLDEFVPALDTGKLSIELMKYSLLRLNELLNVIYDGDFQSLTQIIHSYE